MNPEAYFFLMDYAPVKQNTLMTKHFLKRKDLLNQLLARNGPGAGARSLKRQPQG